jgi:hypothetical protein
MLYRPDSAFCCGAGVATFIQAIAQRVECNTLETFLEWMKINNVTSQEIYATLEIYERHNRDYGVLVATSLTEWNRSFADHPDLLQAPYLQ